MWDMNIDGLKGVHIFSRDLKPIHLDSRIDSKTHQVDISSLALGHRTALPWTGRIDKAKARNVTLGCFPPCLVTLSRLMKVARIEQE